MADFDITLENGKSYTVTAPDVQTAYNALMSMIKSQPPTGPMAPPRADDWATKSTPKSNRFGDVTGEATQQPWEAAKAYGRSVIDPNINITAEKLPEWLPQPVRSATGLLGGRLSGLSSSSSSPTAWSCSLCSNDWKRPSTYRQRFRKYTVFGWKNGWRN